MIQFDYYRESYRMRPNLILRFNIFILTYEN